MNMYEKLGMLLYHLATKETHVTFGKENSIVSGDVFVIKVSLIFNNGGSIVHHKESFTVAALDNMADPHVVADAIITKLKTDIAPARARSK